VEGRQVHVGSRNYVAGQCTAEPFSVATMPIREAALTAFVAVDGRLAGAIEFEDAPRTEAASVLQRLREMGIARVLLLSGDAIPTVTAMAGAFGISEYHGGVSAPDKARIIREIKRDGHVVLMVGDGVNDAPALTMADVGVAMAATGGSISSEAANVVILADSLSRVPELLEIGRRTKHIALQSIWTGLGLSAAGMLFAAAGSLTPLAGAALQEVVDVAVILNALRSSMAPRD
jgi:P-type E1-E2 ATPase